MPETERPKTYAEAQAQLVTMLPDEPKAAPKWTVIYDKTTPTDPVGEHRPLGVRIAKTFDGTGIIVIAFCSCGEAASTNHETSDVRLFDNGSAATGTPSLDWPGHFHTSNPWNLPLWSWPE